jgi:hypothetical protein
MSAEELIKEYADMGYTLTELNGAGYVQKQTSFRNSQTVSLPTLREQEWNSSSGAQQST